MSMALSVSGIISHFIFRILHMHIWSMLSFLDGLRMHPPWNFLGLFFFLIYRKGTTNRVMPRIYLYYNLICLYTYSIVWECTTNRVVSEFWSFTEMNFLSFPTQLVNHFLRWYWNVLGNSVLQWAAAAGRWEWECTNGDVTTQRSRDFHFQRRMGFSKKNILQWWSMCHAPTRWIPKAPQHWPFGYPTKPLHHFVIVIVSYSNVISYDSLQWWKIYNLGF